MVDEPVYAFPRGGTDLQAAMRRARIEEAERSSVAAELRGAELARLEMLREALSPVLAQVPDGVELFDVGIVPGEKPRLFVDMIAFVEMGRDRRSFRFVQDTRAGRLLLAETDRLDAVAEAVTLYIGRRLVERERALASDVCSDATAPATVPAASPVAAAIPPAAQAPLAEPASRARGGYTAGDMLFAFIVGIMAGALGVFLVAWLRARGFDITSLWTR